MESISELQAVEAECIRRFRAKAAEIAAEHPEWSKQICFANAVERLPKTADKYQGASIRRRMCDYVRRSDAARNRVAVSGLREEDAVRPADLIEAAEVVPDLMPMGITPSTAGYLRALVRLYLEVADRPELLPEFLGVLRLVPRTIRGLIRCHRTR